MTHLSPVVWRDGMHLGQHHFQMQQRYFADSIHAAIDQLFFMPFGISACVVDAESLRNGFVSVPRARGLLPDGTPFSFPDSDAPPAPVDVRSRLSATERTHLVFIALPSFRHDAANVAGAQHSGADARLRAVARNVRDETTGQEERPIEFGAKNLRICFRPDIREAEVALPIARLRHAGAGQFQLDETFIPPLTSIGGSESLLQLARRVVDKLAVKSQALMSERRSSGGSAGAFAAHDVAGYWIQHAINASAAPLRHMLASRATHPEALYVELASLAGALCTFVVDADPRDLPVYDHYELGTCFAALEQIITTRLDWTKPTNFARVRLEYGPLPAYVSESTGKSITIEGYRGKVPDSRAYGRAHWILGIRARRTPTELATLVPGRVKVCSANGVSYLVAKSVSGFTLTHLPLPPAEIPSRSDTQYFSITRAGPCDTLLMQTRDIGVHVPDSIPDPQLELLIIYES